MRDLRDFIYFFVLRIGLNLGVFGGNQRWLEGKKEGGLRFLEILGDIFPFNLWKFQKVLQNLYSYLNFLEIPENLHISWEIFGNFLNFLSFLKVLINFQKTSSFLKIHKFKQSRKPPPRFKSPKNQTTWVISALDVKFNIKIHLNFSV